MNKKPLKFNIDASQEEKDQFSALRSVSLDVEEKARLRFTLETFMKNSSVSSAVSDEAEFSIPQKSTWTSFFLSWKKLSLIAIPALIFTISTVSQASLPGQPLYTFKTSVNEPLRRATIFNPEQRLDFEVKLVDERVREARVLKERGQLTTKNADTLRSRIIALSDNVVNLNTVIEEMEKSDSDRSENRIAAAQFNGKVEGSLSALMALVDQAEDSGQIEVDELIDELADLADDEQVNEEMDNQDVNNKETGAGDESEETGDDEAGENGLGEELVDEDSAAREEVAEEDIRQRNSSILEPFDFNLDRQQRVERDLMRAEARNQLISTMNKIQRVVNENSDLSRGAREFLVDKIDLITRALSNDGQFLSNADLLEVISSAAAAEAFIDAIDG